MAEVTIIKYRFREPEILSEEDFLSYKQIFDVEPNHNIAPNASFWEEFSWFKWGLITLFAGIPLGLIWEPLVFISSLAFIFLFFLLLMGGAQSMWYYQTFLNKKNEYYYRLTNSIKFSKNYQEFLNRMFK